jgi:FtsZ-binding cell division protein ZapB
MIICRKHPDALIHNGDCIDCLRELVGLLGLLEAEVERLNAVINGCITTQSNQLAEIERLKEENAQLNEDYNGYKESVSLLWIPKATLWDKACFLRKTYVGSCDSFLTFCEKAYEQQQAIKNAEKGERG